QKENLSCKGSQWAFYLVLVLHNIYGDKLTFSEQNQALFAVTIKCFLCSLGIPIKAGTFSLNTKEQQPQGSVIL
ncbi:hypothetical protein C5167_050949, partial [Papaver somniferum]